LQVSDTIDNVKNKMQESAAAGAEVLLGTGKCSDTIDNVKNKKFPDDAKVEVTLASSRTINNVKNKIQDSDRAEDTGKCSGDIDNVRNKVY
jgi:hypothetical protein